MTAIETEPYACVRRIGRQIRLKDGPARRQDQTDLPIILRLYSIELLSNRTNQESVDTNLGHGPQQLNFHTGDVAKDLLKVSQPLLCGVDVQWVSV
jgi:hypothetical protein